MASVQGEVYGRADTALTGDVFRSVVAYKVAEHAKRRQIMDGTLARIGGAGGGGGGLPAATSGGGGGGGKA